MDWSHPADIHNLFNVDLNLQMYGKFKKRMKTNKYLIFLVKTYISLCAIN